MGIKIGINGFGRIGRTVFRQLIKSQSSLEVVAINDIASPATLAHLLKYDSVHGVFPGTVTADENSITVNSKKIPITQAKDPSQSTWGKYGAQIVLECSGIFTSKEKCQGHFKDSVKKVIVSAPGDAVDQTIVIGVNDSIYDASKHHILSNASCTTNCLAPVVKVLHDQLKVKRGFMTTVHSYTNDQKILDVPHKDLRRARAAAVAQIPTTTGAAKAIGLVIPELKGKIDGFAVRVPTPNVSLIDFVCEVEKSTSVDQVNQFLKSAASSGSLKGVLDYTEEPLVSVDFNGNTYSSTIDALSTAVIDGTLVKVISWYDNETGFSQRMIDLTELVAKQL
ncbi:MAG: type I glyceraldehyde-3-phosphate dehydrogenase [Deltaproteobacteria bacterium]|nr:type I glyceraldehyde-3-phosphate dehydrogenase [Deltaproteobacteria bacterium]